MNTPRHRLPPPPYTFDDDKPLRLALAFVLFNFAWIAGVWTLAVGALTLLR